MFSGYMDLLERRKEPLFLRRRSCVVHLVTEYYYILINTSNVIGILLNFCTHQITKRGLSLKKKKKDAH